MKQLQETKIVEALNLAKHSVLYVGNLNQPMIYISPSVEKLLGHPVENYYNAGYWESLIHPDDIAIVKDFFTRIDEITEFKVTARVKKSDGSYQSIINTGTVIKEDNTVVSIIGNLKPLIEDDSSKKILDFSSYYSETLLDNIGLIFYAVDKDFRIVAKNKLFDKWVWEKHEIIYKIGDPAFNAKMPENIIKEYTKAYKDCMQNGFFTQRFIVAEKEYEVAFSPLLIKNNVEGVSVFHFEKSAEGNLLNTAAYLSNTLENKLNASEELIYTLDKEFRFISYNEAYGKIYQSYLNKLPEIGKVTEFLKGDSVISLNLKNWYQKVLKGDHIDTVLYLGNQVIQLKLTPNYSIDNEICGLTAINQDITRFNESQKKLIESEEKYKYVVDHVTDMIFQTDQEGYWSYLNKAWTNIMEYDISECIGTLFYSYLHPDDVERNQILFTPLINREKSYCTHEIRYITKSGKIKWIRVFATLLLDNEDNIKGTTGTLKDITLEKENSYRYELLSKNANDLICLLETDGTFLYVSPSFHNLLGYKPDELIGKNVDDYFHPEDLVSVKDFYQSQYESKNVENYINYRFKNETGGYHWIETNSKVFYDDFYGRKIINTSSRIIDERRILEQQLLNSLEKERQLNQLKSKFVSMASHEFRTPMTTIKSSSELAAIYLNKEPNENNLSKARKHIHTIDEEVDRLSNLINDILILGKIESETFQLNLHPTDINQLLKDVIDKQNDLQEDKRIAIFSETGIPKYVEIDKSYMDLIFNNLLSNAFKYSKNKIAPKVCINYLTDKVEISFVDHGIGIPSVEQNQIFKSFFRASNTQNIKGTGIGLVLVHYFVNLHGGEVAFESTQNKGTTFKITLPYQSKKDEAL